MKSLHAEFDALRRRFPPGSESSLVLPCLRRIQEKRGFVADTDIDELVAYLGVPRMQIEEVLSYYTQLHRSPIGRFHLQACRNVACSMRGAEGVVAQIGERLGIAPGETSQDGRFTLSTVECLGSCGTAPVVVVNETYHENMTPERLDALIERLSQ
jgi:NADH-quinone oxidoreductase subunit E